MSPYLRSSDLLDVFTLSEPLACVMHAYKRLPPSLKIATVTVFGGGPIGVLHALYVRTAFPFVRIQMVEPDISRRALIAGIIPFAAVYESVAGSKPSDLSIVATSSPDAPAAAIDATDNAGSVILFSGINHRAKDELPTFEGLSLEDIHRTEEVRVVSRGVRLLGSSGYHPDEIDESLARLHATPKIFSVVQTGFVEGLDETLVNDEEVGQPVIIKMLSDEQYARKHLKVLFRMDDDQAPNVRTVYSHGTVKLEVFDNPALPAGTVRIRILRASICQTDRRVLLGVKASSLRDGLVLGHEGIGLVTEVGPGVSTRLRGRLCVVLPHYFVVADHLERRGMGYLSPEMRHLGIHVDGVFASTATLPASCVHLIDYGMLRAFPAHNGECRRAPDTRFEY